MAFWKLVESSLVSQPGPPNKQTKIIKQKMIVSKGSEEGRG